jgi:hypothetical protein
LKELQNQHQKLQVQLEAKTAEIEEVQSTLEAKAAAASRNEKTLTSSVSVPNLSESQPIVPRPLVSAHLAIGDSLDRMLAQALHSLNSKLKFEKIAPGYYQCGDRKLKLQNLSGTLGGKMSKDNLIIFSSCWRRLYQLRFLVDNLSTS